MLILLVVEGGLVTLRIRASILIVFRKSYGGGSDYSNPFNKKTNL
jgi:hypothetical protein